MIRLVCALLLFLSCSAAPSVWAKDMVLDPDAAYALIEIQTLEDSAIKGVNMPGSITLARYDPVKGDVRGGEMSPDTSLAKGELLRVTVQGKPLAKSDTSRLYLVKLIPDVWIIEGANGTAFSLGSNSFTIAPGQIVDLGVFKPSVDWVDGEKPKSMAAGIMGAALFGSMRPKEMRPIRLDWHARTVTDMSPPAILNGLSLIQATYVSDHKFGNYLGGLVNRFGGRAARTAATQNIPMQDRVSQ